MHELELVSDLDHIRASSGLVDRLESEDRRMSGIFSELDPALVLVVHRIHHAAKIATLRVHQVNILTILDRCSQRFR